MLYFLEHTQYIAFIFMTKHALQHVVSVHVGSYLLCLIASKGIVKNVQRYMLFYRIYFVFLSVFEFYYSLFARLSPDKFCYKSLLTFDFDNQIVYWLSRMWISSILGIVFTCLMTAWFNMHCIWGCSYIKFQIYVT